MRYLIILCLLASCSSSHLKYKHSWSKRYLASLTSEDTDVSRIDISLKEKTLFASGVDSTFVLVKLFDSEGNLLTDVDPTDLTLSTSVDLEAKPFSFKQGAYKAEILPRVKSPSIKMRVDWKERKASLEALLTTTTAPLKDTLKPVHHEYFQQRFVGEVSLMRGGSHPETSSDGFSFENSGDNRIVDARRSPSSQRTFHFEYLEQARQNIVMSVDDSPNDTVSHTMHSVFMFFPRKKLPIVEQLAGTLDVTLPTGEKLIFQKNSKEIMDGVFEEGPLDVKAPDRFKRKYADLKYKGKGVLLRVNARGQSPELGQFENLKIDMEYGLVGSADVLIINGSTGQRCRRPKSDFWEPIDVSPIEFKFPTDEEFDQYLKSKCGFSLPKL